MPCFTAPASGKELKRFLLQSREGEVSGAVKCATKSNVKFYLESVVIVTLCFMKRAFPNHLFALLRDYGQTCNCQIPHLGQRSICIECNSINAKLVHPFSAVLPSGTSASR